VPVVIGSLSFGAIGAEGAWGARVPNVLKVPTC
jgi:hypothetical protein